MDRAVIKLPTTARLKTSGTNLTTVVETVKQFKKGDKVKIYSFYNGTAYLEFVGIITTIRNTDLLEIECEDDACRLRQKNINKEYTNSTLKMILDDMLSETGIELANKPPEILFSTYAITEKSVLAALSELSTSLGLTIYMQDETTLYVGFLYNNNRGEAVYHLRDNTIRDDLLFDTGEDEKIKVKVIGMDTHNELLEKLVGDNDGILYSFPFPNINDEESLRLLAQAKLEQLRAKNRRGVIVGFLEPWVKHGTKLTIKDEKYTERTGTYWVEKVTTVLGRSGFRRHTQVGKKVEEKDDTN